MELALVISLLGGQQGCTIHRKPHYFKRMDLEKVLELADIKRDETCIMDLRWFRGRYRSRPEALSPRAQIAALDACAAGGNRLVMATHKQLPVDVRSYVPITAISPNKICSIYFSIALPPLCGHLTFRPISRASLSPSLESWLLGSVFRSGPRPVGRKFVLFGRFSVSAVLRTFGLLDFRNLAHCSRRPCCRTPMSGPA